MQTAGRMGQDGDTTQPGDTQPVLRPQPASLVHPAPGVLHLREEMEPRSPVCAVSQSNASELPPRHHRCPGETESRVVTSGE